MSDYDDEMDARGQDHDLTTSDPTARTDAQLAELDELHASDQRILIELGVDPDLARALADLNRDLFTHYGDSRDDLF